MRQIALAAIRFYQRRLSRHKGFCCAYRAATGGASCSALGARVIRRFGLLSGIRLLQLRLARCADIYREQSARLSGPMSHQRGDCDPGCDLSCSDADSVSGLCDNWGPCDGSGKDKQTKSEKRQSRRQQSKAGKDSGEPPAA